MILVLYAKSPPKCSPLQDSTSDKTLGIMKLIIALNMHNNTRYCAKHVTLSITILIITVQDATQSTKDTCHSALCRLLALLAGIRLGCKW
jgi:hypothetical protein